MHNTVIWQISVYTNSVSIFCQKHQPNDYVRGSILADLFLDSAVINSKFVQYLITVFAF